MKQISTLELRKQLLILVVLIFIPVLGILLYTGFKYYQDTMTDIENDARQLINLFIDEQIKVANQTNQFLKVLSNVPSVRDFNTANCNTLLQAIHKDNPQYSTIVVADGQGVIDCCAIPLKKTINVTDRSWFKRIRESREFVIDNFIISRSAKKASLPFAYPILSPDGNSLLGAVGAAVNLAHYKTIFDAIPLPPDSVIMLTDRVGKILYQSFQDQECLGQALSTCRGFEVPGSRNGKFQVGDIDGKERIYWYDRLSVGQKTNEICLLIGIPKQIILSDVMQSVLINVAMLMVIALLSLLTAWSFGGRFILSPVNRLLDKTRQLQEGDFTIAEPIGELRGELETLSQSFDDMIVKLSQREEERDIALAELQKSRDELEDRVAKRTRQLEARNIELIRAKELANAAKSEFLSNMSHELLTPLNSILGYVQVLNQGSQLTPSQKDGLDIISKSGNHLLILINHVLDLAKIEAGKIEICPQEIDLNQFLTGIVGIIRSRAREKQVEFYFEPLTELPSGIEADAARLRQVILNLLGNAVKFTDKGTVVFKVSSTGTSDDARLRFEIEDTGRGIAPEALNKIFEAFEQVGDPTHRTEGIGLGLNISRKLVRAMGAELQVTSELDKGTCFWFEILVPVIASEEISQSVPMKKMRTV